VFKIAQTPDIGGRPLLWVARGNGELP
jgi:hypothetical protein